MAELCPKMNKIYPNQHRLYYSWLNRLSVLTVTWQQIIVFFRLVLFRSLLKKTWHLWGHCVRIKKRFQKNFCLQTQEKKMFFTDHQWLLYHSFDSLISSMHHTQVIVPETQKPEIIAFYNTTKGSVDALDEKCTAYSTIRRTRRSPLAIFYILLNVSMVNGYVIFTAYPGNPKVSTTIHQNAC